MEWSFHISSQAVDDLKVKVEDIAAPGAIAGTDTVRPSCIAGKAFPVIQKVIRQFICNRNKITKKISPPRVGWLLPSFWLFRSFRNQPSVPGFLC